MTNIFCPGTTIHSRYQLETLLGRGASGEVWQAHDPQMNRHIAIKLQAEAQLPSARFTREVALHASLQHPAIVPVYHADQWESAEYGAYAYLIMPVEDMSLYHYVRANREQREQIPADVVLGLFHQVSAALDYAHDAGTIHCDVKPNNVLLSQTAHGQGEQRLDALLSDFGLAYNRDIPGAQQPHRMAGTHYYMPPEVWNNQIPTRASDIYALAATLFYTLTGLFPFCTAPAEQKSKPTDLGSRHCFNPRPSVTAIRADLPLAIDSVIACGMAIYPDARYATATALVTAFQDALYRPARVKPDTRPLPEEDARTDQTSYGYSTSGENWGSERAVYSVTAPQYNRVENHAKNYVETNSLEKNGAMKIGAVESAEQRIIILGMTEITQPIGIEVLTNALKLPALPGTVATDQQYANITALCEAVRNCDTLVLLLTRSLLWVNDQGQALWPTEANHPVSQALMTAFECNTRWIYRVYEDEALRAAPLVLPSALRDLENFPHSVVLSSVSRRSA